MKEDALGVEKQPLDAAPRHAPAHTSLLVGELLAKYETTVVPQLPYSPDLAPADISFVREFYVQSERQPISDDRSDRRTFSMGPALYPAKRFPGRVPELEKR
jgi:hypothetical protein